MMCVVETELLLYNERLVLIIYGLAILLTADLDPSMDWLKPVQIILVPASMFFLVRDYNKGDIQMQKVTNKASDEAMEKIIDELINGAVEELISSESTQTFDDFFLSFPVQLLILLIVIYLVALSVIALQNFFKK